MLYVSLKALNYFAAKDPVVALRLYTPNVGGSNPTFFVTFFNITAITH